jgi:hypothetical protein
MKKWLWVLMWSMMVVVFYSVLLRVLSYDDQLSHFFGWLFIVLFTPVWVAIGFEALELKYTKLMLGVVSVLVFLGVLLANHLIPSVYLGEAQNSLCGSEPQVGGYCQSAR